MKFLYTVATCSILKISNAAVSVDYTEIVTSPYHSDIHADHLQDALDALLSPEAVTEEDMANLTIPGARNLKLANCVKIKKQNGGKKVSIDIIHDYGCWCRSVETLNVISLGNPVDPVDAACKYYTMGNRCLQRDHPNCDIANTDYTPYLRATWNGYLTFYCADQPTPGHVFDQCIYDVCKVELQGINDQINALMQHGLEDQYKHDKGFVPSRQTCKVASGGSGGGHRNDACCGEYPYRVEYDSKSKRCCHKKATYNDIVYDCCDDGSIKPVGTC